MIRDLATFIDGRRAGTLSQDRAKNYGLVLSGTNARLAPLYDVASALVMPEWNWHEWELAMRINKQGKFKYLRIEDWKKFARRRTSTSASSRLPSPSTRRPSSTWSPTQRVQWTSTSTSERSLLASPTRSLSTS